MTAENMPLTLEFTDSLPRKGGALREELSAEMASIRDQCFAHPGKWAAVAQRVPASVRYLPLRKVGIEVRARAVDIEHVMIEEVRLESGAIVNRARAASPKEIAAKQSKERKLYNVYVGYKIPVTVDRAEAVPVAAAEAVPVAAAVPGSAVAKK
jgi:hypothetical protein